MDELFLYDAFVTMYQSLAFADEAIRQYYPLTIKPIIFSIVLSLGISIPPKITAVRNSLVWHSFTLSPLLCFLLLSYVSYVRDGGGITGLLGGAMIMPYSLLLTMEILDEDIGDRESVRISGGSDKIDYDVILIVDEAIRGDYLDINRPNDVTTNLIGSSAVYNFGLTASATNCSGGTNAIRRYGGARQNYRKYIQTKPSVWEYARARNLRTVYIDAQRTGGALQNLMTREEVGLIDEFIQFDGIPVVDRDIKIAEVVSEFTDNDKSEFILINKIGAHFPVHDKYPEDFMVYKPASQRGLFTMISDMPATGSISKFGGWPEYRNSYKNTLLWNVGEFFRIFLGKSNLKNAVVIYTADHGQDLHEDGSPGYSTHCRTSPSFYEGVVPMAVITENAKWKNKAEEWCNYSWRPSYLSAASGSGRVDGGFSRRIFRAVGG